MTQLPRISASKLTTFRDCRTNYAAKYLQRLKPRRETTYSILGSATHSGIEAGYKDEFPYTAFDNVVQKRFAEIEHMPTMGYTPAQVQDMGYKFLDDFDYSLFTPRAMEQEFSIEHVTQQFSTVLLGGFIDFIGTVKDMSGEGVIDFKTNKKPYTKNEIYNNWQLAIYTQAYWVMYGKPPAFAAIYHIPSATMQCADITQLVYLFEKTIDPTIDELIEFSATFDIDTQLTKCKNCSIFCALKWD